MDVKSTLALKKKRELLGGINKRKMSLRKNLDNQKQNEFRLDITQVTKCVFLGSLCLKPVPQLFDSPLLLEELDMRVGNVKVNDENVESPIESEDSSVTKKTPRRKVLNVPRMKKKSLRDANGITKVIKRENTREDNEEESLHLLENYQELSPVPPLMQKMEPRESLPNEPEDCVTNNNDMLYCGNMKQILNGEMHQEEERSPYDFHEFEEEFDLKLNRLRKPVLSEPLPETSPPDIKFHPVTLHYEDMVRMKREPTPELILSDSDDDTLDQLMYNIMDIKVNPNNFDKNYFDLPAPEPEEYNEYSDEFSAKEAALDRKDGNLQIKKYIKRTPQCKICSQVFPNYIQLKKHKACHNGDKPYICSKCDENHTTLDQLIAHLRTHRGKRPYVCKKCNKGFKTTRALENHQPVHVLKKAGPQKRTFKCEVCGKEFRKLCDLERHTRVHTGEKPSVCNICNKRFQQAHNLNKHLLIHTKEKPFECDICSKRFGRNDVLNRHLLTHSVEKPNYCDICNKSFIRLSQLMAHKRKYHKEV